ncbi:MAG: cytochrome c biogenesis protein CcsA [Prevotella sp.]|nr:cytochrome c biogenesis protein CcsA [Prevotella sp.]
MRLRHIPFLLLAAVSIALAAATFVEHAKGHEAAVSTIYTAWWMIALWAAIAVTGLAVVLRRLMGKPARRLCGNSVAATPPTSATPATPPTPARRQPRPAALLLHLSLLLILAGALVTHLWSTQGVIGLRTGLRVNQYVNSENRAVEWLPFQVLLTDFTLKTYPGTQSPMDYVSQVSIVEKGTVTKTMSISMNNVGEYGGYRFYQSGYDPDLEGAHLMVSHDPWGLRITYTGYGLLFFSMLLLMVLPKEGFRRLLLLAVLLWPASHATMAASAAYVLPQATADRFGDLYVNYNGRICPMQTLAKDFTTKLYGKPKYEGYSAEQVLTGFLLDPAEWTTVPIIKVKDAVARVLGTDSKYVAYQDFHDANGYKLDPLLADIRQGKQLDDARAILDADEKMNILLMLFNGELLRMYPYHEGNSLRWYSQGDPLPQDMPEDKYMFIKKSMDYVGELAWKKDYAQVDTILDKMRRYQQKEGAGLLPSDTLFKAEKLYNTADYTRPLAMLLMTLGIVSFAAYLVHWLRRKPLPRWLRTTMNAVLCLTLAYLLFIITLRGYVAQHLPLSNGFETMQFMALVSLLITLSMQRRFMLLMPFGLLLAGLTLLVAMMGEANPQITLLMPVLASPLLSIHVCVIMAAYSLLAFILLNAITALILLARKGHEEAVAQLTRMSRLMLYPALFCLAAGIFIGALWANQSWGRYWGWDPKEVWALITMLVYSIPMHAQSIRWLQKPQWYHLYMALAFLSILMTYFGVNFFLGGMHSYA